MPPEYDNMFSHIYCNDCEKKCHAKYHFMYHKCAYCKGYNTKLLGTMEGVPDNAVIAEEVKAGANSTSTFATLENEDSRLSTPSEVSSTSSPTRDSTQMQNLPESTTSTRSDDYFCHSCQTSGPVQLASGAVRCGACDSEFVERP